MQERNRENDTARSDDGIVIKSRFLSWLDNFWYYHKWKVIIGGFFAVMLVILLVQSVGTREPDAIILFAGSSQMAGSEKDALTEAVSEYLADVNDDGETLVHLRNYAVYSEEEIRVLKVKDITEEDVAALEKEGYSAAAIDGLREHGYYSVNLQQNSAQMNEYSSYLTTGESSLLIVSPYLYQKLVANNRLQPLSYMLGEEYSDDVFGVSFSETAIYRDHEKLQTLPGHFYICLAKPYVWGAGSHTDTYAALREAFRTMVLG